MTDPPEQVGGVAAQHRILAAENRKQAGNQAIQSGALVFQSQMTFVDRVGAAELLAFMDWLDTAELAISRVDRDSGVLLLTGG